MRRPKVRLLIIASLLLLAVGLAGHYWLVRHTEEILQQLVEQESGGKVVLEVDKARLRYRTRRVTLENVRLVSRDTSEGRAAFDLRFRLLDLHIASFSDLLFRGRLGVPSIEVSSPHIDLRPSRNTGQRVSLTEELGDVYIYIQRTLNNLQVENLRISDGSFSLSSREGSDKRLTISEIGLVVNNFRIDTGATDSSRFFFSDDVRLTTGREAIRFPDSIHVLHYKDLRLSTRSGVVEIDSCVLSGQSRDSIQGSFELAFERIRLTDVNFSALYREGRLRMDSLQCTLPTLRLDLVRRESGDPANTRAVLSRLVSRLAGDLDVRHASLLRSRVAIQVRKGNKTLPFRSENDDFFIGGLQVAQDRDPALTVDAFDFFIRDYVSYTADSLYAIRFDSIRIRDEALVLTNLRLQPARPSRDGSVRSLRVPAFVLKDVDWPRLLLDRELAAREAVLERPEIRIINVRAPGTVSAQAKETVAALSKWVLLRNLRLEHARIEVENTMTGTRLRMDDLVADLVPGELLKAPSLENLEAGLRQLTVQSTGIETPLLTVNLDDLHYNGKEAGWSATRLNFGTSNGQVMGSCEGLKLYALTLPDKHEDVLHIGTLSWEAGSITTREQENRPRDRSRSRKLPALRIDSVQFNNTRWQSDFANEGSLSAFIQRLAGAGIRVSATGDWNGQVKDLVGSGGAWMRPGATLRWQSLRQEDDGTVRAQGVDFAVNGNNDSIIAAVPLLRFRMSRSGAGGELFHASFLEIPDAVLRFRHFPGRDSSATVRRLAWKVLIDTLQVHRTELDLQTSDRRVVRLLSNAVRLQVLPLRIRPDGSLRFGETELQLEQWSVDAGDGRRADGRSGRLRVACDSLLIGGRSAESWMAAVRTLGLQQVAFTYTDRRGAEREFRVERLEAAALRLDPSVIRSPERWWPEQRQLSIRNTSFQWKLKQSELRIADAAWSAASGHFEAGHLSLRPYLSPDSFLAVSVFETDYIELRKGRIVLDGLTTDFVSEPQLHARAATIADALLEIRRDKRMPDRTGAYQPLPVQQLARLGFDLRLDTVRVQNGHVEYTEIGEKSGQAGTVSFDRLEAMLTGLRSRDLGPDDSLSLRARARFLDTTDITMRFRESYYDSLGGFILTAAIAPFDLRNLNPVTEPLAGTRIRRGFLDTLRLRVAAREYLSRGEMDFYFHELNIDLNNPDKKFTSILASPVNLITDLFVIRRNNRSQTGLIFYPRNREKSIFNYWVKLALSGVLTSTGARSNGKYERQYARQLEALQVPPIGD